MKLIEKLTQLSEWVTELKNIIPIKFAQYKKDKVIIAACERYSERIIEDMIIISNELLKEKGVVEREKCFNLLCDLGVLNEELSGKLEKIKGMRNLMIHQYDSFDEELFFESLKELIIDSKQFITAVKTFK